MRPRRKSQSKSTARRSSSTVSGVHTKGSGRKLALCVGINNYPGTGSDLAGCVNDANDWKAALDARGFTTNLVLDGQATLVNLRKELRSLISAGKRGDTLVFTYSGHGSWLPDDDGDEADGRDEMLCPYDVDSGAYLMDDELNEIFSRKADGTRLYFLSDSCHSGTVAKMTILPPHLVGTSLPRPRYLPPATFVRNKKLLHHVLRISTLTRGTRSKYPALLAAGCRDTEYSYDAAFDGRPNGAFTYFALRALERNPKDARQWMSWIREKLPSTVYPQTPSLYGGSPLRGLPPL